MDSRRVKIRCRASIGRWFAGVGIGGILILTLGFLTSGASAAPVDDALTRLDRLESQRSVFLARADSLGRLLTDLPDERSDEAGPLLEQASGVEQSVRTLDVEILLQRERCRSLAREELGKPGSATPEAVARVRQLQDLLDGRLGPGLGGDLIMVEPDSTDGSETLLDKQAYLEDLKDRILRLKEILRRREDRAKRDRSLIRASEQFREQDQFLDEGGRVGSDERILLRGLSGTDPDGLGRVPGSGGSGVTEETFPRAIPDTVGSARFGEKTVRAALARLDQGLTRVNAALRKTEELLRQYETPTR
jgi:hypothetical protein